MLQYFLSKTAKYQYALIIILLTGFSVGMYVGGNVRERVASIVGESDGLRVGRPCKTVGGRVWPVPAKASSLKTPMTKEAAM